jgi:hypothetical protein
MGLFVLKFFLMEDFLRLDIALILTNKSFSGT